MEASTLLINGVIQRNTLLRIPYFQRRYVWKEKDWERFAVDMESTLDSDRDYFLGAIILKEEEITRADKLAGIAKKHLIIDGQQRLTTLCLYMKVLHMLNSKDNDFENQYLQATTSKDPVVIHSCEDKADFRNIMHLDTLKDVDKESNICKAYMFFRDYLKKRRQEGINLFELLNTVTASVTFVAISLKREDDEQQIFDTINSLGVPLTTGELLKNFLYEAEDESAYNSNWKPIFDTDDARIFWEADSSKSRQSKSKENTTIERFFHAFVRIKMWDFKDSQGKSLLSDLQKKEFVKIDNVFRTCQSFVKDFNMDKQELANEIIEYAKLFKQYLNSDILNERIPQHDGIKRISCLVNSTTNYAVIPYVLYILHEVHDESERNRIFGYLETYLIRRILAGSSNNSYSDLFTEQLISNSKKTYNDFKSYIDAKDSQLAMPNDSKIKMGANTKGVNELLARVVLYFYETKLAKSSDTDSLDGGFNDYYTEQLMPKGNQNSQNWPKYRQDSLKEEKRKIMIGTLGNFFILEIGGKKDMKKNVDSPCRVKVGIMEKWSNNIRNFKVLLIPGISSPISEWTEQEISTRNENLAKIFSETIWPVN